MPAKVYCGGLFLGDTIQEKTRTLLGWNDEHCATVMVDAAHKSVNMCARRMLHVNNNSRHYPYVVPSGRLRRNSTSSSSTCSSSSSSEYSQPSPSYSITSYESMSPEPQVSSCTSTDCFSARLGVINPSTAAATTIGNSATTYRSLEREAQVFERLRQLVPMLPFDRSAYQVLIETVSQVMDLEHQLEQLNEQTNNAKNSLRIEQSLVSDTENSVFPDDLKTVDVTAFKRLLCSNSITDDASKIMNLNFVS